jgi:chromosome segregation ATPase
MQKHLMLLTVSAVMASAACAGSQAEQVKDARMEQVEASSDATVNGVEHNSEARENSLNREYDARQENIAAANRPDEKASEDLNAISKDRTKYQSQAETRLEKLGVRINEAAKKIDVLGPRAPTGLRTELQTAATEHHLLKAEIDQLNNSRTTDWESLKSRIDDKLSQLESRVKGLNNAIEDV